MALNVRPGGTNGTTPTEPDPNAAPEAERSAPEDLSDTIYHTEPADTPQPPPAVTGQPAEAPSPEEPKPIPSEEERKQESYKSPVLPNSDTSTQFPAPGETTSEGGKSPLKFSPDAPPVDTVARREDLQVEGELDENKTPAQQIHSSQVPPERDPEKAWMEHVRPALNSLYPRLREGVDYSFGRRTLDGDVELFEDANGQVKWADVEKAARQLAGEDPYANYKPRRPLHAGQSQGEELGERHSNYELPGNVAQSEVNPNTNDKVPSQGYPPPPPVE